MSYRLIVIMRVSRFVFYLGLLLYVMVRPVHAVTYLEQIDRLAAINAALLDFRAVAVPGPRPKDMIELGLEVDPVPRVDNTIGAKSEPVNVPPVAAKVRANWSPVSGFRLGVFFIPPVKVQGIKASMGGIETEYGFRRDDFVGSLRLFYRQGTVTGPFTAPGVEDKFQVQGGGADIRLGWERKKWTWYGGLGKGKNKTQFVLAQDGAVIAGERDYLYGFAGVGWNRGAWTLVAEQHRTAIYLNHVLLGVNYAF